MKIKKKQCY